MEAGRPWWKRQSTRNCCFPRPVVLTLVEKVSLVLSSFLILCVIVAEIILFEDYVVVFKTLGDLTFYVTGNQEDNELILSSVLYAFYESVNLLLR